MRRDIREAAEKGVSLEEMTLIAGELCEMEFISHNEFIHICRDYRTLLSVQEPTKEDKL